MGSAWSYFKGQRLGNHQSLCEGRECSAELAMLRPPEVTHSLLRLEEECGTRRKEPT